MQNRFERTGWAAILCAAMLTLGAQTAFAQGLEEGRFAGTPAGGLAPDKLDAKTWVIQAADKAAAPSADILAKSQAYHVQLEKKGTLFATGPVHDEKGKLEYEQTVVFAGSADEVKKIADADPAISSGARSYTVQTWEMNEGRVAVAADMSDSHATLIANNNLPGGKAVPGSKQGMLLKQPLWIMHLHNTPNFIWPKDLLPRHMNRQFEIEKTGLYLGAGPVKGLDGKFNYGMFATFAPSLEAARKSIAADPTMTSGARTFTLHRWDLTAGRIQVAVDISDSKTSIHP